jgi:acyl-CoA synthetase (AMP-forming)/AMP-acid ligase II/acyl carrier protein
VAEATTLADLLLAPASPLRSLRFLRSRDRESVISYAELLQRALRLLAFLQAHGLKPGAALVLFVRDNRAFIDAFWACQLGGLIAVPLAAGVRQDALARLERVGALFETAWLFSERELWQRYKQAAGSRLQFDRRVCLMEDITPSDDIGELHHAQSDDIAFIQFSSGSTSNPKGVQLSHRNLLANIRDITRAAAIGADDTTLSWMPLSHDMGLIGFHLVPLYNGMDQVLMDTDVFVRRPARWLQAASDYTATLLCSPGFGYRHYLKAVDLKNEVLDLSHVRLIFNGAEPVSPEACRAFTQALKASGLPEESMFPVYGLAEASLAVTFPEPGSELRTILLEPAQLAPGDRVLPVEPTARAHELVCLGHPLPACEIRICDDQGNQLPEFTVGHVQIRGDNVTRGYYRCPACDEVAFIDGWLDTGDLGLLTTDGLFITGRCKDILFAGGQNWYPQDIEAALQHTAGIDADKLAVCTVRSEDNSEDELLVFIQHRKALADFSVRLPEQQAALVAATGLHARAILPVRSLPRTSSGKLQRFRLVEAFNAGEYDQLPGELDAQDEPGGQPAVSSVEQSLLDLCRQLFPGHVIATDQNLFELGADSLMLVRIHEEIEARYPGRTDVTDLFDHPTISELAIYIER